MTLIWPLQVFGGVRQLQAAASAPDARHSKAPSSALQGVQGFIVALPTEWTRSEDNLFSKSHIATIAANEMAKPDTGLAMNQPTSPKASTV